MRLDCGIARRRIDAWLSEELALRRDGLGWVFFHGDCSCRISTDELERRPLGAVEIERTELRVEGDEPAREEFMRLFTLRFMSAGG